MIFKHPVAPTLLIVLCLVCTNAIQAQEIIRGPYLQFSTTSSIRIKWRTDVPTNSKAWYGNYHTSLNQDVYDEELTTEHTIEISGLNAGTKYYYAVGTSTEMLAGESDNHYFKTNPAPNSTDPINIWVLGDAGSKDNFQRNTRDAYYDFNGNDEIDMVLLLGDNAYNDGTDDDYQYGWFEDMYEDRLRNSVMWSCYGNHDGGSADSESQTGVYFDIFDFPTNGECGGVASGTEAYYSVNYGNLHLISLNTHDELLTVGAPMWNWLQDDLDNTDKDWIVVITHFPPYSGYNGNSSDTNTREKLIRQNFVPMLEAAGVDLMLYGHSHVYQRSYLLNGHYGVSSTFNESEMAMDVGDGKREGDSPYIKSIGGPDDGKGTVYICTGSAGPLSENHILNHPVMHHNNATVNGSFAIQVDGLELDAFFIDANGNIDDEFTIVKLQEPPVITMLNPLNGTYYPQIEQINISADAYDSNGSISKVEFFVNNELIGTDQTAPYARSFTPSALGAYRIKCVATDNSGHKKSAVSNIQIGPITFCASLTNSQLDAEENQFGVMTLGSSDLELGFDNSFQTVGIRYPGLKIPKNAIINSAYIQFTAEAPGNINPANFKLYAEDNDDSEPFISENYNLTTRPKTSALVNWSPPNWNSNGANGAAQRTPDIKSLLQEVVFRPGYSPQSSISFLIDGVGRRRAYAATADLSKAPVLCVEYIPFCQDSDNDGTCNQIDQCPGGPEPGTVCDDGNPNSFDDAINASCVCAGQIYDCPEVSAYFGDPCDDNNHDTYDDRWNANCDCEGTFAVMTYACKRIDAIADDAEEDEDGDVSISSGDLELVMDNSNQMVGLRFTGMNIPFGAIIHHATIQFTADNVTNLNPSSLRIRGEANVNPGAFNEVDFNLSARPKTVTNVTWTPADWRKKGKAEKEEETINIAPVIQEVVNRWGYTDTSAIVILFDGIGRRTAVAFSGEPDEAAMLCVDYSIDGPPGGGGGFQEDGEKDLFGNNNIPTNKPNHTVSDLRIFPNPAKQEVHVTFRNHTEEQVPLIIRDMSGKIVFEKEIFAQNGLNHFMIPDLEVANGVYMVQVKLDGVWKMERLVMLRK